MPTLEGERLGQVLSDSPSSKVACVPICFPLTMSAQKLVHPFFLKGLPLHWLFCFPCESDSGNQYHPPDTREAPLPQALIHKQRDRKSTRLNSSHGSIS